MLAAGVLACCSVQRTFIYKPGDTVAVRGAQFRIISRADSSKRGLFYNVLDLKRSRVVNGMAQNGMKSLNPNGTRRN